MKSWRPIAALNNAEWCDVICRSHGARTRFDDVAWTSSTRTPPYYPDAVTLVPDLSIPELLARIDSSMGCSIKDSFASLNLTGYGFRVLFDAQWIVCPKSRRLAKVVAPDWGLVRDREDFAAWVEAWRGDEGPTDALRADVVDHDSVVVLAARSDDRIVAGAIATHTSNVVGISNFFAEGDISSASWSGCLALARSLFASSTLVGYESGDELAAAQRAGFKIAGPLRVWIREG
ncbi:MAG: hypothetical protein ACLPVY_12115 [Acidimicrobiia bacterium]